MNALFLSLPLAVVAALTVTGEPLRLDLPFPYGGIHAIAFSPDGRSVAGGLGKVTYTSNNVVTGTDGGGIVLWDPTTGTIRTQLGPKGESVNAVAWAADGRRLLGVDSEQGRLRIYDPGSPQPLRSLISPDGALHVEPLRGPAFAVSQDGRLLAASGSVTQTIGSKSFQAANTLSVWDLATGDLLWSLPNEGARIIAFAPDGSTMLAFSRQVEWSLDSFGTLTNTVTSRTLTGWDSRKGTQRFQVPIVGTDLTHLKASPGSSEVLIVGGLATGWYDPSTGQRTRPQSFPFTSLGLVQFDRSGDRMLVTSGFGDRVALVQFSTGSTLELLRIPIFQERLFSPAAAPDLSRVATIFGVPKLVDLPTPRIVSSSESAEGAEFIVEAPVGSYSELRFRTDLDSLWTVADAVLSTTNRFVLRDTNPAHRTAPAGFWQVYFD